MNDKLNFKTIALLTFLVIILCWVTYNIIGIYSKGGLNISSIPTSAWLLIIGLSIGVIMLLSLGKLLIRYESVGNLKSYYKLLGAITCAFGPIFVAIIPIFGWFILGFYNIPLYIIGHFMGNNAMFINVDMFVSTPASWGWVISFVFWFVIGIPIGQLLYQIRFKSANKKQQQLSLPGFSGIIFITSIFILLGLLFSFTLNTIF
jgi:hypothetical protein